MQVTEKVKPLAGIALTFALLLLGQPRGLCADHPPEGASDWYGLEKVLEESGVALDTSSLIQAATKSTDITARMFSIELLGRRRQLAALEDLRKILLGEQDPVIRQTVFVALARMGDEKGRLGVEEMLRTSSDQDQRAFLATCLGEIRDFVGYAEIIKAARSKNPTSRLLSSASLVKFYLAGFRSDSLAPDETPIGLLLTLLVDTEEKVRRATVLEIAIGENRGLEVDQFLQIMEHLAKNDSSAEVRAMAEGLLNARRERVR